MNRRQFFSTAGPTVIAGIAGVKALATYRGEYVPMGYVTPQTPGALDIDHITLDGERVEHVTEFDDVHGWLRNLVVGPDGKPQLEYPQSNSLRMAYRYGEVRVHWKAS